MVLILPIELVFDFYNIRSVGIASPVKVTHKIVIQAAISHLFSPYYLRLVRFKSNLFNHSRRKVRRGKN